MITKTVGFLATLITIFLPAWQEPLLTQGGATPFGFQVGEERRYELGPSRALLAGERASWSIRLRDIEDDPSWKATFELRHERTPRWGENITRVFALLTVNEFGFPLRLEYQQEVSRPDGSILSSDRYPSQGLVTVYQYTDQQFAVSFRAPGEASNALLWSYRPFDIAVRNVPGVKEAAPSGIFLYTPWDTEDPTFYNPGLLSFVGIGSPGPEEGDRVFLTPSRHRPAPPPYRPREIDPLSMRDGMPGNIDRTAPPSLSRYFSTATLKREGELTLSQGGRQIDVVRYSIGGEVGAAYVDRDGVIVRVDVEGHLLPRSRRWIRLLSPWEY